MDGILESAITFFLPGSYRTRTFNIDRSNTQRVCLSLLDSSEVNKLTNGLTERVNSVIEQYLRCYSNFKDSDWYNFPFLAEFSYYNSIQESIKYSPFYANYGYNPRYSPSIPNNIDVSRADEYTKDLSDLSKTFNENLQQASKKQEQFASKHRSEAPNFKLGNKVWLNSSLVIHKGNKKLRTRKLGLLKLSRKSHQYRTN